MASFTNLQRKARTVKCGSCFSLEYNGFVCLVYDFLYFFALVKLAKRV